MSMKELRKIADSAANIIKKKIPIAAESANKDKEIELITLDREVMEIKIEGMSPLMLHRFSEKAFKQMAEKNAGKAVKGKQARDPEQEYQDAMYRTDDGKPGFPLIAFKNAAVTAVTSLNRAMSKVLARQAFFIIGETLTEIYYPKDCPPIMDESAVRISGGKSATLRYRPKFRKWGVKLVIEYNKTAMSAEQVVNLINLGGYSVGVGEHRVEKNGNNGRFRIVDKFSWEKKK